MSAGESLESRYSVAATLTVVEVWSATYWPCHSIRPLHIQVPTVSRLRQAPEWSSAHSNKDLHTGMAGIFAAALVAFFFFAVYSCPVEGPSEGYRRGKRKIQTGKLRAAIVAHAFADRLFFSGSCRRRSV